MQNPTKAISLDARVLDPALDKSIFGINGERFAKGSSCYVDIIDVDGRPYVRKRLHPIKQGNKTIKRKELFDMELERHLQVLENGLPAVPVTGFCRKESTIIMPKGLSLQSCGYTEPGSSIKDLVNVVLKFHEKNLVLTDISLENFIYLGTEENQEPQLVAIDLADVYPKGQVPTRAAYKKQYRDPSLHNTQEFAEKHMSYAIGICALKMLYRYVECIITENFEGHEYTLKQETHLARQEVKYSPFLSPHAKSIVGATLDDRVPLRELQKIALELEDCIPPLEYMIEAKKEEREASQIL